jgi:hypothetical protein
VKSPVQGTGLGYLLPSITYGNLPGWEYEWEQELAFSDDLTIHKSGWGGEHDFKMGIVADPYINLMARWWSCEFGCYAFSADSPGFPATPINYDQLAAAGKVNQLTIGLVPAGPKINYPVYGWYFQDDWRPASKLTVNLGIRWDVQTNSMLQAQNGQPFIGTFYIPGVYDRHTRTRDLNNYGPRVGLAYDLQGDGRTVLRANAGLFYGLLPNLPLYIEPRDADGQNSNSVVITNPHFTNWNDPLSEIGDPTKYLAAKRAITVNANDMVNPYAVQVGAGVSHQLTPSLALKADYVHIKGSHELQSTNLNAPDPVTGKPLTDEFGPITEFETTGRSDYDALMVGLDKRMSNNLQFMASYTLAKANNTVGSIWEPIGDPYRPQDEYGPATADRRHRFTVSGITTALPWGIQLSAVMTMATDRPFDIRAGVPSPIDYFGFSLRPPGVTRDQGCRGVNLGTINDFRASHGLGAVNSVACPGEFALDIRVAKAIRLGTSQNLDLMFEVYNLTGADNLAHNDSQGVTTDVALSNTFGQAIVAGPPRQAQLGIRFRF